MRQRLLILFVVGVVLALPAVPVEARPRPKLPADCPATPCVVERAVPLPAGVAFGAIDPRVRILLPRAYDGRRRLPVLYLLHGAGDTYRTWVDNTDVESFAAGLGVVVVMPDGGRSPDSGWYSDWADGSRRWESFHIGVLIPWVDATFATLADRAHRGVAGLSMGGFGAMSYAGRHPELFGAAATFSGAVDTQLYGPLEAGGFALAHDYAGTPDERVWGEWSDPRWTEHNPAALARAGRLRGLSGRLWVVTGTGTPGGPAGDDPANPAGYGIEQLCWQLNQSFELALRQSGTAFVDRSYLGGLHSWPYWQYALHLVLPDLARAIS